MKQKNKKGWFLSALLSILTSSLLRSIFTDKVVVQAGEGVIRAGEGQNF